MAVSQRRQIKIQSKFYPVFCNICPICAKNFGDFQSLEVPKQALQSVAPLVEHKTRAYVLCSKTKRRATQKRYHTGTGSPHTRVPAADSTVLYIFLYFCS
jgi:hypothetical protein